MLLQLKVRILWVPHTQRQPFQITEKSFKIILEFPKVIEESAKQLSPSIICSYVFNLVKTFNSFYQAISILKEKVSKAKSDRNYYQMDRDMVE